METERPRKKLWIFWFPRASYDDVDVWSYLVCGGFFVSVCCLGCLCFGFCFWFCCCFWRCLVLVLGDLLVISR